MSLVLHVALSRLIHVQAQIMLMYILSSCIFFLNRKRSDILPFMRKNEPPHTPNH